MRFQTPQFIDIEDKIFGPLTFKQFVYLAGSGGIAFVLYNFLPFLVAVLLIAPVAGLGIALAFYRPNNKPFVHMLESAFRYVIGAKLYLWRRVAEEKSAEKKPKAAAEKVESLLSVPKLSESKLRDLSWSLDVREGENRQ